MGEEYDGGRSMSRAIGTAGLLLIPPLVFQRSALLMFIQALLLIGFSLLRGRRFRIFPNVAILSGVTLANLFTPVGAVLFRIGRFPVTAHALEQGLIRGFLFIGLVYLSRSTVSGVISFPGRGGKLLSRTLFFFESIMDSDMPEKEKKEKKGLIDTLTHLDTRLDAILLHCSRMTELQPHEEGSLSEKGRRGKKDEPVHLAILVLLNGIFWTMLIYNRFFA
jgi:hypothetical protein